MVEDVADKRGNAPCKNAYHKWETQFKMADVIYLFFTAWNPSTPFPTIISKKILSSINFGIHLRSLQLAFPSPKMNHYLRLHSHVDIELAIINYPHCLLPPEPPPRGWPMNKSVNQHNIGNKARCCGLNDPLVCKLGFVITSTVPSIT